MHRLQSAFRVTLFLRAGVATMALAFLLAGCGGGGLDEVTPAAQALMAPARQAPLAAPQVPDANALFDWAEGRFAALFPGHKTTLTLDIYLYRFYPETGIYLAVGGQDVYVLVVGRPLIRVGALADFACQVNPASCVTVSSLNGKTLYETPLGNGGSGNACRDCHGLTPGAGGATAILNAAGTQDSGGDASVIRAAINEGGVKAQFAALTDAQLADIAAYINATRWGKPLQ
jgi:cytochrome c553